MSIRYPFFGYYNQELDRKLCSHCHSFRKLERCESCHFRKQLMEFNIEVSDEENQTV